MVGIAGQRDHYPERASNVGASRRWASWFLDVADENGGFFRTPIGHPAFEVVSPDRHAPGAEEPESRPVRAEGALPADAPARGQVAEIVRQMLLRREHTAQLLKDNQQLRTELSSLCHAADDLRVRTKRLVSLARGAAIAPILVPAVMTLPVLFETFPCAVYLI